MRESGARPDAFSTLLWNNEPRKSNETPPTRLPGCSGAKAALSFSWEDRKRPPRGRLFFSAARESPGLFFRIYRGRKSCRELWKLDWLAAKDSPGCAAVFEKFITRRVPRAQHRICNVISILFFFLYILFRHIIAQDVTLLKFLQYSPQTIEWLYREVDAMQNGFGARRRSGMFDNQARDGRHACAFFHTRSAERARVFSWSAQERIQ